MNKQRLLKYTKGQVNLGQIVVLAVALILGALFAVSIADGQAVLTNTRSVTNETVTFPDNGTTLTLNGQALVGSVTAVNASNASLTVPTSNFSTTNLVQVGGEYRLVLTNLDSDWDGESVNLSYTFEPVGYNRDAGARGIAPLTLLFFVLAVLAAATIGIREWLKS